MSIFHSNIFRHFLLEIAIALAIPALHDEKYNWSNSTGQGLKAKKYFRLKDNSVEIYFKPIYVSITTFFTNDTRQLDVCMYSKQPCHSAHLNYYILSIESQLVG